MKLAESNTAILLAITLVITFYLGYWLWPLDAESIGIVFLFGFVCSTMIVSVFTLHKLIKVIKKGDKDVVKICDGPNSIISRM